MKYGDYLRKSVQYIIIVSIIFVLFNLLYRVYLASCQLPKDLPVIDSYEGYKQPISDVLSDSLLIYSIYVAFVGSLLTFIAFWVQYVFNKKQRNEIKEERFLNQFQFLISLHKDVVNKITIGNVHEGQCGFHFMFYEFKSLCYYIRYYFSNSLRPDEKEVEECIMPKGIIKGDMDTMQTYAYWAFSIFQSGLLDGDKPDMLLNERIAEKIFPHNQEMQNKVVKGLTEIENSIPKTTNSKIPYMSKRVFYNREKAMLYQGYFRFLSPYIDGVEAILDYLEKTKDNKDICSTISFCQRLFASQMTMHELGLLYAYFSYKRIDSKIEIDIQSEKYNYFFEKILSPNFSLFKFDDKDFFNIEK